MSNQFRDITKRLVLGGGLLRHQPSVSRVHPDGFTDERCVGGYTR
jgi:hypothetical protein